VKTGNVDLVPKSKERGRNGKKAIGILTVKPL
jgi:hypothetical protein